MIAIRAPEGLRSENGGIWYNSSWTDLDVDRVDLQVNNNVIVYPLIDEETPLNQLEASTHNIVITGHINADSALIGNGVFGKTKNLVLAAREWYVGLSIGGSGFPEIRWNNKTWDFLIQKLMIIDEFDSGDAVMNYQISTILGHE